MTITIVGVLPPITKANEAAEHEAQRAFLAEIGRAVYAAWPSFQAGHPPITITVVTLPEVRPSDAES